MIASILKYIIIPLELICCKMFFETFCSRRKIESRYRFLFWILLGICLYAPAVFWGNLFLLKQTAMVGILAAASKWYWDITFRKSLILSFLFQSLLLVADYIAIIIDSSVLDTSLHNAQAFLILLSKMILFLLIIFMKSILKKRQFEFLGDAIWIKFLFFPAFTICIIALISKPELMVNENQKTLFWIFAAGLVGMSIMLFYLLQDVAARECELFEQRIFEREAKHKLSLYESMAEAAQRQQALSHEYQNQLVCIQSLLHKQQYRRLEEYIEQITGIVLKNLDHIDTGHAIVNAILNEKYAQAADHEIVMVYHINNLSGLAMADQDVVLLLSNLLNNAIEACLKCTGEKIIKVKFILENSNLILSVKNTYDGHVITSEEHYLSTKTDPDHHGIGIKNMIQVITKYDGFYSITHDEKYFSFSCVIPIEPCR